MNKENIFDRIVEEANKNLPTFLATHGPALGEGKQGIYLTGALLTIVGDAHRAEDWAGALIGSIAEEYLSQKSGFSLEKTKRLTVRKFQGHTERTSLFTQNYAKQQYGGGVIVLLSENMYLVLSGSNFPPIYDTLFVAEALLSAGVIDETIYSKVMEEARTYEYVGVPEDQIVKN